MISGLFLEDTPFMQVFVAWGQAVQATYAVLDTGFSGDLQVTPQMAEELGLEVIGVTEVKIASGEVVAVPAALAMASMEREIQTIEVLIAESMPPHPSDRRGRRRHLAEVTVCFDDKCCLHIPKYIYQLSSNVGDSWPPRSQIRSTFFV